MILPLIVVFGIGATAGLYLAQRAGPWWVWVAAFLQTLIALHEVSFAFRRVAEWIRIDLLLTIPIVAVCCLGLGVYSFRRGERLAAMALVGSLLGIPAFLLVFR